MNKVVLSGRVANDIEIKPAGDHQKGSFRLAVQDRRDKDKANFFNVEVWNKAADIVAEYAPKGSFLIVEGRLEQNTWQTDDGQNRERVLVVADNVELGPKTSGSDAAPAKKPAGKKAAAAASSDGDDDIF